MNKKALDQFQSFTDQRADLVRRTQENDRSEEKIRELIGTLDLRKDEAIERTFKVVAAPLLPHAARGLGVEDPATVLTHRSTAALHLLQSNFLSSLKHVSSRCMLSPAHNTAAKAQLYTLQAPAFNELEIKQAALLQTKPKNPVRASESVCREWQPTSARSLQPWCPAVEGSWS